MENFLSWPIVVENLNLWKIGKCGKAQADQKIMMTLLWCTILCIIASHKCKENGFWSLLTACKFPFISKKPSLDLNEPCHYIWEVTNTTGCINKFEAAHGDGEVSVALTLSNQQISCLLIVAVWVFCVNKGIHQIVKTIMKCPYVCVLRQWYFNF